MDNTLDSLTPEPKTSPETPVKAPSRRNLKRDKAIAEFLERWAPDADHDLLGEMITTICRLGRDKTGRGELKLLNTALKELRYAFKLFAKYSDVRKVSIFGSARTPEEHADYQTALQFGHRMAQENWMIITGAGDGIMRAGHGGAGRPASFGVSIRLPFEQKTNEIIAADKKLINFKYFFTRKLMFIKEASAVALFPGGFGTQDECFESLTLIQTGKAPLMPIVMLEAPDGTYWQHWRTYVAAELLRTGMISPDDMHLFSLMPDVETAVAEITHFYKRYHSMRYVFDTLVLRLNAPVSNETLAELNDKFAGILVDGRIEQRMTPLPEENGDWPDKPRLTLAFDKKSYGQLRLLVNHLNDAD
jgi:uncharacterized protein (TIGR00730 family)